MAERTTNAAFSWDTYEPPTRLMTSDDWQAYFEAWIYEDWQEFVEVFEREPTLREWAMLSDNDPVRWDPLRVALEEQFGATIDKLEWAGLTDRLRPTQTTLGELCDYLAGCGGRLPVVEPLSIMGRSCPEAGTFLALRHELRREGVRSEDVLPSSTLASLFRGRHQAVVCVLSRICPSLLRELRCSEAVARVAALMTSIAGLVVFIIGSVAEAFVGNGWSLALAIGGLVVGALGFVLFLMVLPLARTRMSIDGAATVRDLCRLIAGTSPGTGVFDA